MTRKTADRISKPARTSRAARIAAPVGPARHQHKRWQLPPLALAAALVASAGAAQAVAVTWVQNADGFWDLQGNWSTGALPTLADDVALALAGTRTITFRSGSASINSLAVSGGNTLSITGGTLATGSLNNSAVINVSGGSFSVGSGASGTMNLSGGSLALGGVLTATGAVRLAGGSINGGTVQQQGSNGLVFTSSGGTLNGVAVRGAMTVGNAANTSAYVRINGGLTLLNEAGNGPGTLNVGTVAGVTSATVGLTGTQSLNNATINLGSATQNGTVSMDGGGTVTLGAGVLVQGSGAFGRVSFDNGAGDLVNAGTFSANIAGRTLTVNNTGALGNSGLLEARNGGTLTVAPGYSFSPSAFTNTGTIRVVDAASTVNLGGVFSTAGLGSFDNSAGGKLQLTGTLNNTGATLTLSASTGAMLLAGGTVNGGTVQQLGGVGLGFTSTGGTLSGVTVRGTLNVGSATTSSATVTVSNGMTVLNEAGNGPGVINVLALNGGSATLALTGSQTLNNAVVNLGSGTLNGSISLASSGTFSPGSNLLVQGSGFFGNSNDGSVSNAGTISANYAGRDLYVRNATLANSGLLEARNGGVLRLESGGAVSNTGTIRVADAASTVYVGGSFGPGGLGTLDNAAGGRLLFTGTLNNAGSTLTFSAATGAMALSGTAAAINGGTIQQSGSNGLGFTSNGGLLNATTVRGTLNVGTATDPLGTVRISNGLALLNETGTGPGTLNVGRVAGTTGATVRLTAGQTLDGMIVNLGNAGDGTGNGSVLVDGSGTVTLGAAMRVQGFGSFGAGSESSIVNAGTFSANVAARALNMGGRFTNSGLLEARDGGTLSVGSSFTNFSGTTLTAGSYAAIGASSVGFGGANVVTNAANILLDGANAAFLNTSNATNALANFATNATGASFTIRNGRNFTTAGAFSNAGLLTVGSGSLFNSTGTFSNLAGGSLQLAGGSFSASSLASAGTVGGFGTVSPAIANTGLVQASGGTLVAARGVQGSGNVAIDAGATLDLGGALAGNTVAVFNDSGSLNLGSQNLVVARDYHNANSGSGNTFNRRAGVSGSGQINGLNAAQTLSGDVVATGANAFRIDFGNVRGGRVVTRSFQVTNSGSGADIRGALQTGAAPDARLGGSGVVAGNFGPVAAGASSGSYSVTFAAGAGGGALGGQSLAVVSNFDNVAASSIALTGFGTVLAQGLATPAGPIDLGNFRVGLAPTPAVSIAVQNTTSGDGAERLGIASATASGNFAASNTLGAGFVMPGATLAAAVGVATAGGVAGVNNGAVAIQFASNGQLVDASFANTNANLQTVALTARGYVVAQPTLPSSVNLGNFRLVGGASQALTISNTISAPAGYQESLNGTAAGSSAGVTLGGSFSALAAGASSSALTVGFDAGGTAGARNGTATMNLVSNGSGSSGLGLLALASQTVNVSGTAFNLAAASAMPAPLMLPSQRVGGSAVAAITVGNTAPAGMFSEALNAAFAGSGGSAFGNAANVSNLAAGASSSVLGVGVDTAMSGLKSGSVTLAFQSDGSGSNGHSGLAPLAIGTQTVAVSGKVYAPAVAQLGTGTGTVDFGIVRVGDAVAPRSVTVANGASSTAAALTDTLRATITTNAMPFAAAGTAAAVVAGGSNNSSLNVGLSTAAAGIYNGTANVSFTSQNPDMADLPLAAGSLLLSAQVNNLAVAQLAKASGAGSFSGSAGVYSLNFGARTLGASTLTSQLQLGNVASGPADALGGSFDLRGLGSNAVFNVSGFGVFGNLQAGSELSGLVVTFNASAAGSFDQVVVLNALSTNGSGPDLALAGIELHLVGQVVAVPEPAAPVLMAGGLALLGWLARRRVTRSAASVPRGCLSRFGKR